jgi:hypothetical protein
MKIERTEDQMLSLAPIAVKLGEAEYDIKPLPLLKAAAWRKLYTERLQVVTGEVNGSVANIGAALTAALLRFPETLAELVFAFAPDLPKDQITETATDEQMARAFSVVMVLAFPYWDQLKTAMDMYQRILTPLVSHRQQ